MGEFSEYRPPKETAGETELQRRRRMERDAVRRPGERRMETPRVSEAERKAGFRQSEDFARAEEIRRRIRRESSDQPAVLKPQRPLDFVKDGPETLPVPDEDQIFEYLLAKTITLRGPAAEPYVADAAKKLRLSVTETKVRYSDWFARRKARSGR